MEAQPVALVTGGSKGIGRGISVELADKGFTVVISYKASIADAEETLRMIEKAGGKAELCQADVQHAEHRDLLLDFCMENLGRLDVLVNNAAIGPPETLDLLETTEDNYDAVLTTNLKAPFFLTQAAARIMIEEIDKKMIPSAAIINVSSVSAYAADPERSTYCVSKAGLSMVTSLFATRLAEFGINVYEVRPGVMRTGAASPAQKRYEKLLRSGAIPANRWGKPQDVGKAVAMLACANLPFSTGEIINVDGGLHLRKL